MQNHMMNSLTRLGSAFAFVALAGCSTMSSPTLKDEDCIVGEESKGKIFLALPFTKNAPEQYSLSCREGRAAAQIAYIGKNAQGRLNPKSALVALEFNRQVQDKIKTSEETNDTNTKKFYQDVSYFFGYYLNKIGGKTIDDIQNYVDELRKTPAPSTPKPPPRCGVGGGIIRSCPSEPTVRAPAAQ